MAGGKLTEYPHTASPLADHLTLMFLEIPKSTVCGHLPRGSKQLRDKDEVAGGKRGRDAEQLDCAMVRHGDHGVVAMPDDLEVGDALNSVKPVELKPVFALVEVQDDIMAEPAVARSEFVSSSETERVVAAS